MMIVFILSYKSRQKEKNAPEDVHSVIKNYYLVSNCRIVITERKSGSTSITQKKSHRMPRSNSL